MQKNDLLYVTTTGTTAVAANGLIPFSTIARRRGCALDLENNSILLKKPGYYKVSGTITFTAPAAGVVSIQAQKSGTAIPGLLTGATVTTAATQVITLPIEGIVRVLCCDGSSTLTLLNTGVAITLTNLSLDVVYLG